MHGHTLPTIKRVASLLGINVMTGEEFQERIDQNMPLLDQARSEKDRSCAFPSFCTYSGHVTLLWPSGKNMHMFSYKQITEVLKQVNDEKTNETEHKADPFTFAYTQKATTAQKKVKSLKKRVEQLERNVVNTEYDDKKNDSRKQYKERDLKNRIKNISMKSLPDLDPKTDFRYLCRQLQIMYDIVHPMKVPEVDMVPISKF